MRKSTIMVLLVLVSKLCISQEGVSEQFINNLKIQTDIVYLNRHGAALTFDMIQPQNVNGASVIFVNSGGFESGKIRFVDVDNNSKYLKKEDLMIFPEKFKYPPLAQYSIDELLLRGFTVFDLRCGSNPKFDLSEITDHCKMAVKFIKKNSMKFNIDSTRIGVFGASSGGYLASFLGLEGLGVKSVAVYYPTGYDLMRIKKNFPPVYDGFDCLKIDTVALDKLSLKYRINSRAASFLIIYGKDDFPFITIDSEDIAAELKKNGITCDLISITGTGHEFRGKDGYHSQHGEFARRKMVEWFEKHL